MRILGPIFIHTKHFPPEPFNAITLWPFVFYKNMNRTTRTHESIHWYQQLALLWIPFYLFYFIFYLVGIIRYRNRDKAYFSIPFERAAYKDEHSENLTFGRKAFGWMRKN